MTRFLLFYFLFHLHDSVVSATHTSFRCLNTDDEILDSTVSPYVVNNGVKDCVSGRDETLYANDPAVTRNGMVAPDSSRVYPFAMACIPGNPLSNIFPDSQFACPGDYGELYDCDKLCDGYLQCDNGWDEDVCFTSDTASCVNTRDLPESEDGTYGLFIYPRQCELFCKHSFVSLATWYAIIPGSGDEGDECLCFASESMPAAVSWEKCDEPCYYGNGFIPCGSTSQRTSRAGTIRRDQTLDQDQCTVTAPSCVAPFDVETVNVKCPSMESIYTQNDQTIYKVDAMVSGSKCYIASQERDGTNGENILFIMPNIDGGKVQVSVSTALGELAYTSSFDFCPKRAVSVEISGSQFQPLGLPTDLSMTIYGGEFMQVSLVLQNEGGTPASQIIENSLSLMSTLGTCTCNFADSTPNHGDILSQEVKNERVLLPYPIKSKGYVFAASACIHYKESLKKEDPVMDNLRLHRVSVTCPTEGYEFCTSTSLCHPADQPCDTSAETEYPKILKHETDKYDLKRFLEGCGCESVFADAEKDPSQLMEVEAGEYIVVEINTISSAVKFYIEGDSSVDQNLLVLDKNFERVREITGSLSIQIHISEEKVIDLTNYATVSTEGAASVVAQIQYNSECDCGSLETKREVMVQSVPKFVTINDSAESGLNGHLESTNEVVVGPGNSGPIRISATGTDVRYYFSAAEIEGNEVISVITGDDGMVPEFQIECGCKSGRCTHVVDALLKNDLAEIYQVKQPLTIHCDHCNLPSLTLELMMKPATGGDEYPVPSLVGRDENVLITFVKTQTCDVIHKCTGSDAEWSINGVLDENFVATELPYNLIERQPNKDMKIEVCQKFCKYIDGVSTETPVRACGSVTFKVSPSKCALENAATTSIVLNSYKMIEFSSKDPDNLGACDKCFITVNYTAEEGEPAVKMVEGSSMDVEPPVEHGYTEGEKIGMEYCCSDSIPNRPHSCISHSLEVISPGAPEIELVENEELKRCSIDCDEFAEFEVDVQCDNCDDVPDSEITVRWRIKREGYECNAAAPDYNYFWGEKSLDMLSNNKYKFKTINVCSIFESPKTEGLCLCVFFKFSRAMGGRSRTLCRFYEQNFGPVFDDSFANQYEQDPPPQSCEPVVKQSNLSFDSDLATGIYKPITFNALINDVPTSAEDLAKPKFTLFLRSGFTAVKLRATDSCGISTYHTISVPCENKVSQEAVNGMMAGLKITDKKSQSEAISKIASASSDCDAECTASATNVLDGASVEGDDSVIQVTMVANTFNIDDMDEGSMGKIGNLMGKSFSALKKSKGKNKARSTKSGSSVIARTLSASNAKFAKRRAAAATTTTTTTTTAAPSTMSALMNETDREPVCGSSSGQDMNLATTLRTALGDLSSSAVCGLAPGDSAPTVRVTEDNPIFEMNCTRSSNQLFPDTGTHIPVLPEDCANDSCALCTIRFLGCADPMPAPNAPDSEKISIKLMKIQSEEGSDDCSLELVKVRDLPLDQTIEFTNKNLDPIKVPMTNSELTQDNNYLAVDVEISTPNSGLIIDFCLNISTLQASELIVRGRYNFSRFNWTEEDFNMEFTPLTNSTESGDEFIYVFDPRNFNGTIESVAQDGMGVISSQTQDECLDTETVVDKCYRVFVSGFTLGDQVGDWSIIVMAQFPDTADETTIQPVETVIYSTSCLYYDESLSEYTSVGTSPSPSTSCAMIKCRTTHLSSFGGSFFVPPNNLDVMNSLKMLGSLNENPTVFVTIMVVLGLYIFIAVWCRRKDKKDEKKLGIAFLADNDPNDTYQYDVTVYTGIGGDAGTSSNVTVVLCGDQVSRPHVLFEEGKELFCSGSVDSFILTTPKCLGDLESIQIWHNNKGNQPSWYLKHILVKDLQNNKQYIFLNNRWLAVDKDDGQVEREIPVATDTELKDFTTLFKNKIERDLWDGNIWFSVFGRPVRSNFTRVQRASCCLCLLYCTMLANIMFFGAAEGDTSTVSVMGVELSWTQVMIGLQCNFVIFPVNFLIVYIFKNAKPKIPKELKQNEEFKRGKSLVGSRGHHRSQGKSMRSFTNLNSASRTSIQSAGQMTVSHTSMFKSTKTKKPSLLDKIKGMFGKKPKKPNPLDASTCSIESVINEAPPDQLEEGKKAKGLPWWTVFIGWFLMGFVSFVAAFFTLLYGMQYGKEKSNLWLKTFLMGFFESLFFVQPVKMICLGLFFALLIKKPEQPDPKEQQRMEIIEHTSERGKSIVELDYSDYKRQYKKLQKAYVKPCSTDIEAARKYREKMKKMWDALFEIGRYFLFLFLLSTIVNAQTDPRAYLMTENIRNMFTTGTKWPAITKYGDVWTWMYTSLIPGLYNQQWYNGNVTDNIQGFTHDKQSYLVGAARIRQVRMDPLAVCKVPKELQGTINDCYGDYSLGNGDTQAYDPGWKLNETIIPDEFYLEERKPNNPVGSNAWVYVPQLQADGIPIWGDMNVYGPGGYIMTLNTDMEKALEDVRELQANNWLDTLTRAIIVEFTVFNPNVNLFSVVSLVVEFNAQGDGHPFEQMKTLRLYPYMSGAGYLVLVCQLVYAAFLIYYMWVEAKEIKQLKWKYLRQFWNWIEIVIIGLSWTSFGLLLSYLVGVKVTMNQIKEFSDTRFISFGGPATVNESYRIASAATVYFGYLKLMHMLRFNKKMSSFAQVLKVAANDITNFMIMFTVVFVAFAQFAYLVLGAAVSGYKSFITTSTTLMAMLLGQWDYYEVEEADRLLGPGFLFTYIVAANLILLNVFLSIICEACDQVNGEVAQQENDFEVVDFMMGQVKMLIGADRLLQNANKKMEEEDDDDNKEDPEKKSVDIDAIMCDFEGQMNYISGHYCGSSDEDEEDEEINKMLDDYDERSLLQGSDEHSHSFSTRSFNIAVQK